MRKSSLPAKPGLATAPFDSAPRMLARSAAVFFKNLRFLATLTLIVYLPGKLLVQLACFVMDVPTSGILSYFLLALSDLVLAALAVPAAIYGLTRHSGIAESLHLARERWGRMLWNEFKVEITITLWGALLIVPGLIAMVRLIFVEPVVALEDAPDPLARSRELTRGYRWRIFGVVAPLGILELIGSFGLLNRLEDAVHSRIVLATAESVLAVFGQWMTVAVLLMYLAIRVPEAPAASPARTRRSGYRGR